jgi:glycosyltransferase involved in cell wall biosynthesis
MRILIIAEHASLQFGGEAALPVHYFRVLRNRKIDVWMIVHERTRKELSELFSDDLDKILFIKDTIWHKLLFDMSKFLPSSIYFFTFGSLLRTITQLSQIKIAKSLIKQNNIDIIHQPIPVSPKEPSLIYDLGVPVVIGPMNGGMSYPEAFKNRESYLTHLFFNIGRYFANWTNILIPGKRKAATLIVANERTKKALPDCVKNNKIIELVENGVDLSIWKTVDQSENQALENDKKLTIVYLGRLVDWKGVDLLIKAFKHLVTKLSEYSLTLEIIGDGKERSNLEKLANSLGLNTNLQFNGTKVIFRGRLSQLDCAKYLQQAQMMILPSLYECGGAVVLEAMTMKLPVIATNWGGPADYLDDSCGILVNPDSEESFMENLSLAMEKLIKNPDLRKSMGEKGYQKVIELYDWEHKIDQMQKIYQEILHQ